MKHETITIRPEESQLRVDSLLKSRFPEFSRAYFQYLIEGGFVKQGSLPLKKRTKFAEGESFTVNFAPSELPPLEPEPLNLEILYEDETLIAINKRAGMVVHPGAGNRKSTLVHGLLHYLGTLPSSDDPLRPGVVHRLDKETTGVIIAAKTREAQAKLIELFKERKIEKTYIAITHSRPKQSVIDAPIGRHPVKREMMTIRPIDGKKAITHLEVVAYDHTMAYVIAKPVTGRTHQIRVHLKSINAPIVGDDIYGIGNEGKIPLCLHAHKLHFTHPVSGQAVVITAPIPQHIEAWGKKLEK